MGIIKGVLQEEYDRLQRLMKKYGSEAAKLPAGSLSIKKISGHEYAYVARRIDGKVVFTYLGKSSSPEVRKVREEIGKRRDYESKIKVLKKDLKELERALGGKKI